MKNEEKKPNERSLIVFDETMYNRMISDISKMLKEEARTITQNKEWISYDEAKNILGVRSKTKMQQLRDHGEIVYSALAP